MDKMVSMPKKLENDFFDYVRSINSLLIDEKYQTYATNLSTEEDLKDLEIAKNTCGIYMVFLNNVPVYVGKAIDLRNRIRQHFVKKHAGNSSLYDRVHKYRKRVTLSYCFVSPTLYSSIEAAIIDKHKSNGAWWGKKK